MSVAKFYISWDYLKDTMGAGWDITAKMVAVTKDKDYIVIAVDSTEIKNGVSEFLPGMNWSDLPEVIPTITQTVEWKAHE